MSRTTTRVVLSSAVPTVTAAPSGPRRPGERSILFAHGYYERWTAPSMAATHVRAPRVLIGRHRELIGQPARVKQILCNTATDLGREPRFQGRGLVDVLRALQSI